MGSSHEILKERIEDLERSMEKAITELKHCVNCNYASMYDITNIRKKLKNRLKYDCLRDDYDDKNDKEKQEHYKDIGYGENG